MEGLAQTAEQGLRALPLRLRDDGDESDAHIEGSQHLVLRYIAELLQVGEERRKRPACSVDLRGDVFWQDAWEIFRNAAAGDVGHAGDSARARELANDRQIAAVYFHQRGTGFFFERRDAIAGFMTGGLEDELAGERITV